MAAGITVKRRKTKRGAQMRRDDGWRLVGRKVFLGTLLRTINYGPVRLAVFTVVCTENPIRIVWGRESPNVSAQ